MACDSYELEKIMDLFAIAGTLRRYKVFSIAVLVLTLCGMFYMVKLAPVSYAARADVLLASPPAPPTAAQIAADPKLARVNTYNPYAALGNLSLVADVVIEIVESPQAAQALAQAGVEGAYSAALDTSPGNPPSIDVTGNGSTTQAAIQSANLVVASITQDLQQIQTARNVDPTYMITAIEYLKPTVAEKSTGGKVRSLAMVLVVGLIVLLVGISIAQARDTARRQKWEAKRQQNWETDPAEADEEDPVPPAYRTAPGVPQTGRKDIDYDMRRTPQPGLDKYQNSSGAYRD
jgi:capsular polysaccharide biosynthesis protein